MRFCTLTGVDRWTDTERLLDLTRRYPFVEWGVLLGRSKRSPDRYQEMDWIEEWVARVAGRARVALHVCEPFVAPLLEGEDRIGDLAGRFGRVQVNFGRADYGKGAFERMALAYPERTFVTQHKERTVDLWRSGLPNHEILFDLSEGRGIAPETWLPPLPGKRCGYAGALGPHVMRHQLPLIAKAAGTDDYWTDLETKARDEDDRFCLFRCETVLMECEEFMIGSEAQTAKLSA